MKIQNNGVLAILILVNNSVKEKSMEGNDREAKRSDNQPGLDEAEDSDPRIIYTIRMLRLTIIPIQPPLLISGVDLMVDKLPCCSIFFITTWVNSSDGFSI
jgi:hypothetical protein